MSLFRASSVQEIEYIPIEPKPEPMETNEEKLINAVINFLDFDVSELELKKDTVADPVACVETGSLILKKIFKNFPMVYNTVELVKIFRADTRFRKTEESRPGVIWVAVSKMKGGVITKHGHLAFQYRYDRLASNDSKTGIFWGNYTPEKFEKYYKNLGLEILKFEII